jgi:hypothetical protein
MVFGTTCGRKCCRPTRIPCRSGCPCSSIKQVKNLVIREAVRLGEYLGYFSLGEIEEETMQEEEENLQVSAEWSNSYAQYALGKLLLARGDKKNGVHWLTAAAERGNIYAQYFLLHLDDFRNQLVR